MPHAIDVLTARALLNRAIMHLSSPNGEPSSPTLLVLVEQLRAIRAEIGLLIEPREEA